MIDTIAVIALMLFAYWLGWKHRDHWDWMRAMVLKAKRPEAIEEQPKSMILEPKPETPTQRAKREQEELLEGLNR